MLLSVPQPETASSDIRLGERKMLIHKSALAVSEAVTKEETRYFLSGALFEKDGAAVATNGHTLIRFTGKPCNPADFPTIDELDVSAAEDVIIASSELAAAKATMVGKTPLVPLRYIAIVPNGEHVTLATSDGSRRVTIIARKPEGAFPAYQKILKVDKPIRAQVRLSVEELGVLIRAAKALGVRGVEFELRGDDESITDQVLFTAETDDGTLDGAIMPMRR